MSAMRSSSEILEQAARDGSIDISEWPRVLENVLQKLHDIVHNDFPLPPIPPTALVAQEQVPAPVDPSVIAASPPTGTQSSDPPAPTSQPDDGSESFGPLSQSSVNTNKENAPPVRPPVPSFSVTPNPPSTLSVQRTIIADSPLPPDLLSSYQSSVNILRNNFASSPPYTVQRLAELVLQPRRHYRFLPPFLSALDRAVSVTSPLSDFPLPQFHVTGSIGFLANGEGANGTSDNGGLGSDESLGGALLTPIPWIKKREEEAAAVAAQVQGEGAGSQELRTEGEETIDGPHGVGRVETVSVTTNGLSANLQNQSPTATGHGEGVEATIAHDQELRAQGAVTQGELLRQEQESGVVVDGQEAPRHPLLAAGGLAAAVGRDTTSLIPEDQVAVPEDADKLADDHPHARGPDLIGMEDTGPQPDAIFRHLDMEAAAGKKESSNSTSPVADQEQQQSVANVAEMKEGDPSITEGNAGGAAETAAGEKRKRIGDDDGKEEDEARNDDKEMTDV
ncbi:hypothetical protein BDV97DRAFT_399951 [Delphinella strobiligena]|nr:hypothetical protein BDV97DRAFT_399951 [Delphinella strobiligena]